MAESPWVKIAVALISAMAIIIAAWIGASARHQEDKGKTSAQKGANTPKSEPSGAGAGLKEGSPDVVQQQTTTSSQKRYEITAAVGEDDAFVDPKTGFVFAADEITNAWNITGVLSRYTLPDGTAEMLYRRKVGTRIDFQFEGQRYYMVIEDIDYKSKKAHIRIRSI